MRDSTNPLAAVLMTVKKGADVTSTISELEVKKDESVRTSCRFLVVSTGNFRGTMNLV